MKIPRNRQKLNIDVESLPTIINFNNIPSLSSSPEDSGFERSSGSANSDEMNIRKCLALGKDKKHNTHPTHGKDNGILTATSPAPDKQFYDEGYFDLVKRNILPREKTPL